MVTIVEYITQVSVEWVNLIQARELIEDTRELVMVGLLRELDLARVECADARDGPSAVAHSWRLALRAGQYYVDKVFVGGHWCHPLKVVKDHGAVFARLDLEVTPILLLRREPPIPGKHMKSTFKYCILD